MKTAIVIGGGPAGLMAADELSRAGAEVIVIEGKPSLGRKFLMAGKSGLNLTMDEVLSAFTSRYEDAEPWLRPMLDDFGPQQVMSFANNLGQEVFTGSSGRVFPKAMKASPFLRAWIERLVQRGVTVRTKWLWSGWDGDALVFGTPEGHQALKTDVAVFALGGSSWSHLGSDGAWAKAFTAQGIDLKQFAPSNAGIAAEWSAHMQPHFGTALKAVAFRSGPCTSRGEAVISQQGLEGGGIYSVSNGVREGHALYVDLKPDWTLNRVAVALSKPRGKSSFSNHLRRALKLQKHELALLNEWAYPLPQAPSECANVIKNLKLHNARLRPMDDAISTSGGVSRAALDKHLMLLKKAGTFCAGEMLDWEAPTGGYLLTACFATGRTAGRGAARYLGLTPAP
ncbi:TIGR03862 family flavoprotein [Planktotalea sp.]|uniref:TIGR03862 family flavoprotein n=1 Tax=Planktotalea sp. TaxID=2029877 RepID=UPI0025F099A4|nr:TIGR03862 family flavoprotein [Planktotalea sp.]